MQKLLLQRRGDEYLRSLRILLRDVMRNSRVDFDLLTFTRELISEHLLKQYYLSGQDVQQVNASSPIFTLAGGLADFNQVATRERYVNSMCDLCTVCMLVAITPHIKEAYVQRRQAETRDLLIKYYMTMTQVQCDTVCWLQEVVLRSYQIAPTELIRCMFKVRSFDKSDTSFFYKSHFFSKNKILFSTHTFCQKWHLFTKIFLLKKMS